MRQSLIVILSTACLSTFSANGSFAVDSELRKACDSDYVAYCSQHEIDSPGLRTCMRAHRKTLTESCARALATAGEATAEEIREYKRDKNLR